MDIDLTLRKPYPDREIYSVHFDGINVGSILFHEEMGISHESYWQWTIATLIPGALKIGKTGSLDEAKREFRAAFEQWIETVPADEWAKNREYTQYVNRPDRYTKQRPD